MGAGAAMTYLAWGFWIFALVFAGQVLLEIGS